MATEIERKFLVRGDFPAGKTKRITQAYLSLDPERTVRVRLSDEEAFLTIKGKTSGIARAEFEFSIPYPDGQEMLALAVGSAIHKTRHLVQEGSHLWEVDVFEGDNAGLVVAEVELDCEEEEVTLPNWIGEEVSHDSRYVNACLVTKPFKDWV